MQAKRLSSHRHIGAWMLPVLLSLVAGAHAQAPDPLPSWNDGTLWSEQPVYFQLMFVRDRVIALAPKNPAWKAREPFAALIKGDMKAVAAPGAKAMAALMATPAHSCMTTAEFEKSVSD